MRCFKFLNDRKDTCQAQFVKYNKKLNYKRYGWNRKKKLGAMYNTIENV